LGGNTRAKIKELGIKGWIKEALQKIIEKFKSVLLKIGNAAEASSDFLIVVICVVCIGTMLNAVMGVFGSLNGPFSGKINIDFDKFEEMNSDTSIYMDAQNTNELRKAYMQLVSETSYYQVFNLRDLNPESMNIVTDTYAKIVNKLYDWGLVQDDLDQMDLNYYNMTRNWIGLGSLDERYIYSDANKNALKYMKLPKIIGINVDEKDLKTSLNTVNETFRDYYNRETTFQISETLLSEMNRILFGEFSNLETITYPEAFVKPVAFVNDFYRIQETGKKENIGSPYVYVTQRVTLRDINNISSVYYEKDWLEGIIKSEPSHIVYDYVVEQKNNYYWSEANNELAKQMSWGNIGKYATVTEEFEYEDGSTVDKKSAIKLYWRVIDTRYSPDTGKSKTDDGNNPFNEHMGTTITNQNYKTFFEGPYTRLNISSGSVKVDTTSLICDGDKSIVYINPENGNSSDSYIDGWVKVRCEYNKYPIRHMQLVSVFDEYGDMQLNSRVLFNKTFVQKKSVRDSYRFFPEYFSGFEDFANVDLNRCPPARDEDLYFDYSTDSAIPASGGSCEFVNHRGNTVTTCEPEDYENDAKLPFNQRHCSVIRRYTGASGYAYTWAKWKEFGQSITNLVTGEDAEAEINISSESMFHLLLAYDDYIIETGEYGVAWDYKYYTETELDLAFKKAQYRDIFGLKEVVVDKWNSTTVYKKTLDTVKALDSQRTVSTTYVPTSIISGQSALCQDQSGKCNNNNNNSGYGWKISNVASDYSSQVLERVKGEASLELPVYSTGNLITKITDYLTNGVHYGPDDFRYSYDASGDIVDSGPVSWEAYINDLDSHAASKGTAVEGHDGNTVSLVDALKAYNEGGDWRNTTEAWDSYAKTYRPTNSGSIHTNITSGIDYSIEGRVTYKTYRGDYLPYETKSVRDYGLGSVLSYIQDMRVVYQTGVFMDETYVGKSAFEKSFETIIGDKTISDNFGKAGNGYYPKELLDRYPSLTEALRSTPIPVEDLMELAQNIVSLQYAATDYEMDLAEEKASSKKYEDIRAELVKIVAGRNMEGIYVGPVNEGIDGFPLISKDELDSAIKNSDVVKNNKTTNICESAYDKCDHIDEDDIEGLKQCLLNAQATGAYYNEGLFDCERRCKTEAETEIKGIHPDLNEEEKAEEESVIKEKETRCLKVCEENWPDLSQICTYSIDPDKLNGVYAYSPYLEPTWIASVWDTIFGGLFPSANTFTQVQFLDPLQYYVEWFDWKAEDDDSIISKALHFVDGSKFVTEIHVAGSAALLGIQNTDDGLSKVNVDQHFLNIGSDFAGAGENIVGEFKKDFYNQYGQDLQPMNLILENESYRIYMIDEAVTFLGTFNYTYKNDIVNIGGGSSDRQVSGLAYADRYYYLSNYIFNVPMVEYVVKDMGSGSKGSWNGYPACPSYTEETAQTKLNGDVWKTIVSWFTGEAKPKVLDAGTSCKYTSESKWCTNCCSSWECTGEGEDRVCGWEDYSCYQPYYTTHYNYYATVSDVLPAKDGYIIDTPAEIKAVLEKASSLDSTSTLSDRVYIGMKIYDSLSDWSWGWQVNKGDIDKDFSHDYNEDYLTLSKSGGLFDGDNKNHYQNIKDVNANITARKGYVVPETEVTKIDVSVGLPDDLHMSVDLDAGLQHPVTLKNDSDKSKNDLYEIWRAADAIVGFNSNPVTVGGSDGWSSLTLEAGTSIIHEEEYDEIGVGLFIANRESYGYPIPLFRHFSGVMREILPRQRGYYFNGEVFDSWNSRLILTDDTTEAQKNAIFEEKNKTQSYLYDYIMNFETYVPMDVKSDYDLMSRGREAYHSTLNTKTNHVENTAVLSNDIYNLANTPAWEETIKKFGNDLNATAVSQLISGLLEVSIDRAPQKMISILNQNILDDNKKVADTSANRSIIENAVNGTLTGGSSNLNSSSTTASFYNTLFLGDSLTVGIKNTGLLDGTGAVVDAVVGRGIVATKNAAKSYSNYGTVFINIGMNDATNTDSVFESNYKDLVNTVKSKNPGATIYIGSISGVNDSLAASEGYLVRNADINKKNQIIEKLAGELGVNFMDVNAYLGNISTSDTNDGIHLKNSKYTEWFNYICNTVGVGGGSSSNMVEVTLSLEDGSSKTFRLTDVGPGVIFYNYNPDKDGNLPTSDNISTGDIIVTCGPGTDYTVCFDDVSLTVNDTTDERLDKVKALKYVSNKFGKLVQKYGDVKYAILAYFHGEAFATKVQLKGDTDWFNGDDANKVADILAELTGDDSVRMNASKINMFMYTNDVVTETLAYVKDSGSKTVLNNASTIPAAASGVPLGTKKEEAQRVYSKWKPLFDTFCAEYQVDVALAVAMFTQESSGNAFAGLCKDDSVITWTTGATAVCTEVYSNVYNSYNGGGGIGQIHHHCDGDGHNAKPGEKCTKTIESTLTGKQVVVNMQNPESVVTSLADIPAFLANDERYGNVEKAFEYGIIQISNNLIRTNNDGFLAAVLYNGWVSGTECKISDPNWYSCYSKYRNETSEFPDYVKHIARYYDTSLATAELNTNFGLSYSGASATGGASFGLQTGNIAFQRDMFQVQNSGMELYIPRMTTSRDDVTTLILNVSNFGKEDYYMYANEHSLLDFFTERLDDSTGTNNSFLGGNPQISKLGKKTSKDVDASYKFAFITPLIPLQSPISTVPTVTDLNVTSEFGKRVHPVYGDIRMHNGVDIAYTTKPGILAAAEGRVSYVGYDDGGYGHWVEIEHTVPANTIVTDTSGKRYQIVGIFTRYAHMFMTPNVVKGDVISSNCASAGGSGKCLSLDDPIGIMGNSGVGTGDHLHFEVLVKAKDLETGQLLDNTAENTKCDPYYWLSTEWTRGAGLVEGAMSSAEIDAIIATVKSYHPTLSQDREYILRNALSLVGGVPYFYGGGHSHPPYKGVNPSWGRDDRTCGHNSPGGGWWVGRVAKDGLDCSGFVSWVSYNTFGTHYYASGDTVTDIKNDDNTKIISKSSILPGDWAFKEKKHIGIYVYTDSDGKEWYVHSTDKGNEEGVVFEIYNGFDQYLRADYVN